MLNFFYLQTAEGDAMKWSEKQKIEYTANTPPGAKKGDWLAFTGVGLLEHQPVYLLCISSDLTKCFFFPLQTPPCCFRPSTVQSMWSQVGISGGRKRDSSVQSNTWGWLSLGYQLQIVLLHDIHWFGWNWIIFYGDISSCSTWTLCTLSVGRICNAKSITVV